MTAICKGTPANHCCWINGKVCKYFEIGSVPGRSIACGLLRKYGSWDAMEKSAEYQKDLQPFWDNFGGGSCGGWPRINEECCTCGVRNHG